MADERRARIDRADRRYRTYGNVAYQAEYERDNAVRRSAAQPAERPQRRPEIERRPRIQPHRRTAARPVIRIRAQDAIAPFSIVGFAVVLLCALFLVAATAQLAVVNNDIVDLRAQMTDLQEEERQLQAQYETAFDLEAIEEMFTADGSMVRPGAGQTVYLDMAAGDSVVYYEGTEPGFSGLLRQMEELLPW